MRVTLIFARRASWGKISNRLMLVVSITGIFSVLALLQSAWAVGSAHPCPHGGNASATACVENLGGAIYYGGYDNFSDNNMTTSYWAIQQGNHVNNEMWFYTHSNLSQWVEVGIRQGYWPGVGGSTCNCAYGRFWADFDSLGYEHRHAIAFTGPTGANHTYEIIRDSGNHNYWDVYVDYNFVGQSTDQYSAAGYTVQMGLEDSDVSPDTSAATFNHSPLEYMATNGAFYRFSSNNVQWWVDYGCGEPGAVQGYCLNGVGNGSDVWYDSKAS